MRILAVDSENTALSALTDELKKVFPQNDIYGTVSAEEAIEWAVNQDVREEESVYAFLGICISEMNGIQLAKALKEFFPSVNLVFCTAHTEYALEAFELYAKGYLIKPITAEKVEKMLDAMVPEWRKEAKRKVKDIKVHTFGHFEVYVDGNLLSFKREKAKELFALLIDRHGAAMTTEQIAVTLWEDAVYDREMKNIVTAITASLRSTLREAGVEDVLVKTWNHLAIDINKIKCDAYEFEKGNPIAINYFHGEYMSNYSWAEFSTGKYVL